MGEPAMKLEKEQLEQIGEYVKTHLPEWISQQNLGAGGQASWPSDSVLAAERSIALSERMVRVEEELKAQRELMQQGFDMMEKRFEQVDKRFTLLQWFMGISISLLMVLVTVFQYA